MGRGGEGRGGRQRNEWGKWWGSLTGPGGKRVK